MARNEIVIDASPEQVYETPLDANCYPEWVMGAEKIRDDPTWPRRGSRFHHKVGAGPAAVADSTKLVDKKPNKRVVLEVRLRPRATGTVALDLRPKRRGHKTRVVMSASRVVRCRGCGNRFSRSRSASGTSFRCHDCVAS